jgi:putative SOS response-associated peptidase YedK
MCGRFTQQRPSAELAALFEADDLAATPGGRFNLAPQQSGLVVVEHPGERRSIVAYRWGLVPTWAKEARIGNRLINARAETVATTPAFRGAFQKRRCLVPADAFYEWERVAESIRQPNLVRRADGEPMAFAGLWSPWRDPAKPEGAWMRTFAIVTTRANATLAPIHDRMPAILSAADWGAWLDPAGPDTVSLLGLLRPAADDLLIRYPVSKRVNSARNEGSDLVVPLGPLGPEPGRRPLSPG